MPRRPIEFLPAALEEVEAAAAWYRERSPEAAAAFKTEIRCALRQLGVAPERWPLQSNGTRRIVLHRFPFLLVYRIQPKQLEVLAVAHARRRPGYWRHRTGPERPPSM